MVVSFFGFPAGSAPAEALRFFVYDSVKVVLLLAFMVFLVSIVRTFITRERIRKWLGGRREGIGNVLAALLGVPTPFCSCSAVPIFIGFVESGIPLGITFSFLVSAPMVNEVAIALLLGLFGWKIALLYVLSGLFVAVVSGIVIGRLGLENQIEPEVFETARIRDKKMPSGWNARLSFARRETARITFKVVPFAILGIAAGALIHGFVPVDFLAGIAGKDSMLAVPVAVLVGIPLYSNAAGTVPIVQALMGKGMALGTALAFMMSVTALSFPELVILRRVLKPKLLAAFVAILFVSFVLTGILFNALLA
ncbi:MAG: permease [Candidatus Diapherotrites archaeon]|nr:permease [Candidatus Diapherotrites archaeon]